MEAAEKSERLIEAACALLAAVPGRRLNAVVLNKALFYFDLAMLRDQGESATGNTYIALQQGPVVAKYPQRLIAALEARGLAMQSDEWDGSKPIIGIADPPEFKFLHPSARAQAAQVANYFALRTSREVSEFSHDNPGWSLAWSESRRSGKPCPIDMHVAMQQILQDDPWMDEPLSADERLLAAADSGDGIDW